MPDHPPSRYVTVVGVGFACVTWLVSFGITLKVLLDGIMDSVPYDVYVGAAHMWRTHQPLYELETIDGFQYLPQTAIVFVPFLQLGAAGGIVWRVVGWALYALGVWRVSRTVVPERAGECFTIATCLSIAPAVASLQNGQSNLLVSAIMLHVVVDLSARRWNRVTIALLLGLAFKPLMVVPLGLTWALYRPLTWRIPIAVLALLAFPFLLGDHRYVGEQYSACVAKLALSGRPGPLFEDARGLAATVGWAMSHTTYLVVRLFAALTTLALGARLRARLPEPTASMMIVAAAATYLMLFNPRTQSNTYVIVAPFAALLGVSYLLRGRSALGAVMVLIVIVGWSANTHWLTFLEHWLKPGACVAFFALITREALRSGEDPIQLRAEAASPRCHRRA